MEDCRRCLRGQQNVRRTQVLIQERMVRPLRHIHTRDTRRTAEPRIPDRVGKCTVVRLKIKVIRLIIPFRLGLRTHIAAVLYGAVARGNRGIDDTRLRVRRDDKLVERAWRFLAVPREIDLARRHGHRAEVHATIGMQFERAFPGFRHGRLRAVRRTQPQRELRVNVRLQRDRRFRHPENAAKVRRRRHRRRLGELRNIRRRRNFPRLPVRRLAPVGISRPRPDHSLSLRGKCQHPT